MSSAPMLRRSERTRWWPSGNSVPRWTRSIAPTGNLRKHPAYPWATRSCSARAWVHYSKGEFDPAAALLGEAAATYASLGETDRYMRARHLVANMTLIQGRVREAEAIYKELLAWGEAENDLAWIARESNTLGRCAYELRDLSTAVQHFHRSLQAFRELGMDAESIRPEWGFALVVLASGKPEDALRRFEDVRAKLHERAM